MTSLFCLYKTFDLTFLPEAGYAGCCDSNGTQMILEFLEFFYLSVNANRKQEGNQQIKSGQIWLNGISIISIICI